MEKKNHLIDITLNNLDNVVVSITQILYLIT